MTHAIIATGNKQYHIQKGDVIYVDRIHEETDQNIKFPVLAYIEDNSIVVNPDELSSVTVTGKIVEHLKGDKVRTVKIKKRKKYRRTIGSRPYLTKVEIIDITTGVNNGT